jgi:hypothetical protein
MNRATEKSKHASTMYALVLKIGMTHEYTIERLHELFGCGHINFMSRENDPRAQRPVWNWTCMSGDAEKVIAQIQPYMVTKATEAAIALQFAALGTARHGAKRVDPALQAKRQSHYEMLRELKKPWIKAWAA